jgi:beta-galactosidase
MSASADFYPHRIYKVRTKASLNAGWQTVNVPHSAQYDPPTINGELQSVPTSLTWNGVHWYRKSFTIPSTAHNQRIFLEFEGAMQIAEVWVNGTKVGTHDASGYSGFFFDISTAVNRTGSNVVTIGRLLFSRSSLF